MYKIGIMQGRLSERPYPALQDFPKKTWEEEFVYAKEIGLDSIEWLFKSVDYKQNPIWTFSGREEIKKIIKKTGIKVDSLCADYFLEKPFFNPEGYKLEDNILILKELIKNAADIGVNLILIPVLEEAEIQSESDEEILCIVVNAVSEELEKYNMRLGLETELKSEDYLRLIEKINNKNVGIYYDAGNCASKGYDMYNDMIVLKDYIFNIHVKDRIKNGPSVFLGKGDTNFKEGIPYLVKNNFKGKFILQTYYEDDYIGIAKENYKYIKSLIEKG